jgi:uncharacterized protein
MTKTLVSHALAFGRELRAQGSPVSLDQIARFVRALELVGIGAIQQVREAGHATLVTTREELEIFDRTFDRFWPRLTSGLDVHAAGPPAVQQRRLPAAEVSIARALGKAALESGEAAADRAGTWSAAETLRHKRFDRLTLEEAIELRRLIRRLDWNAGERRTRRYHRAARGRLLDWRRTLQRLVRNDGELIERTWKRRSAQARPIVAIADISGSMERYSRMILTLLHTVAQQGRHARRARPLETFVFGTRLTRITRRLAQRDLDSALDQIGREAADWGGGTRIGESLRTFNRLWARRVLGHGAIVLVISDGWDQGDPDLVAGEMERLRKSSHGLIWLNPLAGMPGYEPRTRGMMAALPFTDALQPAHNLASLERLVLTPIRPARGR